MGVVVVQRNRHIWMFSYILIPGNETDP